MISKPSLTSLRILHLSDLHAMDGRLDDLRRILKPLLDDVAAIHDEHPFDIVIFSGDLAHTGTREQLMLGADELLRPLLARIGLPAERLVMVPGNHDVDRRSVDAIYELGLVHTLTGREQVNALLSDGTELERATHRLSAWHEFRKGFYPPGLGPSEAGALAFVRHLEVGELNVGVAALDSAWRSSSDDDKGLLLLGDRQVTEALAAIEGVDLRLVVAHHPLDWLARWDAEDAQVAFEKHPTIVFSGHDHQADPTSEVSARGAAIYSRAGCLHETVDYRNSYSVIDVIAEESVSVSMRTWWRQRGEFDQATERAPGGVVRFAWPAAGRVAALPRRSKVTGALARVLERTSAYPVPVPEGIGSITERLVAPRLWPAPHQEVLAAERALIELPMPLKPLELVAENRILVINGEAGSGVTGALLWLAASDFETSGRRVPVHVTWPRPFDPGRLTRAIRDQLTLMSGPQPSEPADLLVVIDDVVPGSRAAMAKFVRYLREHEHQAFIIGCHGSSHAQLAHVLGEAGLEHRRVFLGPLSRRELRDLVRKRVGERSAEIVDKVLGFVRGQSLPATPAILSALVEIVAHQADLAAVNPSSILDAHVRLLLEDGEMEDTEGLGLDSRRREALLSWLANLLAERDQETISRLDADIALGERLAALGWPKSYSPGEIITSLIRRRVLAQSYDGELGFRHAAFFHLFLAKWMAESSEFAHGVKQDPLRYSAAVVHAAGLQRNNTDLLRAIGAAHRQALKELPPELRVEQFDQITRRGRWLAADHGEAFNGTLDAPEPAEEQLDSFYEFMQLPTPQIGPPMVPELERMSRALSVLSRSLRTAELVDDLELKVELFKQGIEGGSLVLVAILAEDQVVSFREHLIETIKELGIQTNEITEVTDELAGFVDFIVTVLVGLVIVDGFNEPHLGEVVARALEDERFMEPNAHAFLATMVALAVRAPRWRTHLDAMGDRLRNNPLLSDILHIETLRLYASPDTSDEDARHLETKLLAIARTSTGRGSRAVLARARTKDEALKRLRDLRRAGTGLGRPRGPGLGGLDEQD